MTKIIGHRGARNLWPENSLGGFRKALDLGVDAIEFDVHLTESSELVVIHDAMLDRTTEASGPVRLLTSQSRPAAVIKGCDEAVPTLDEVLIVLAPAGIDLHVEIKADEAGHPYPDLAARVAEALQRHGVTGRTHLTSFDTGVLETCRALAPTVPRLVSVDADWADRQGGLATFLAAVEDLADIVAIEQTLMASEWDMIRAKWPIDRLCVWTVNDAERIADWLGRGIGHLTSDSPHVALEQRATLSL